MITDDHAHLDHEWLTTSYEMDDFINTQKSNNVKYIITQGLDLETSKKALALAKKYDIVLAALGFYPMDTLAKDEKKQFVFDKKKFEQDIAWIKKNLKFAAAIGEVGLDYSYEHTDIEMQKYVFQTFIDLSLEKNMPLIIHSRKAEQDVIDMLLASKVKKAVLHCFSGKKKLVEQAIKAGYYFSIPTNITRSQHFQMIVKMADLSKLFTETDAPFLSPFKDDKPNEPRFIAESIKMIAQIKNMTPEEVALAIFQNFQRLYL
jgi:TatD DNase family protein